MGRGSHIPLFSPSDVTAFNRIPMLGSTAIINILF